MNPSQLKDRVMGTIVGFAVRDALGMPAQFLSRE
jgi:ADP-ribosylglycohydrolase